MERSHKRVFPQLILVPKDDLCVPNKDSTIIIIGNFKAAFVESTMTVDFATGN